MFCAESTLTHSSPGGEGLCSWDAVEAFSDAQVEQLFAEDFGPKSVCDAGPKNHNPNNWEAWCGTLGSWGVDSK